jgi:CheY-like chemotaxis protein
MPSIEQADYSTAVLLVDDDQLVRTSISRMLVAQDYRVLEASDGEQALNIWQRHRSEIDLLVTDISMPGMSGIDLVDRLATQAEQLKALYISGYPELLDTQDTERRPVPFLQKPFTREQLSNKLRALLNRPLHGWQCPRCSSRRYRGLTAGNDGQNLELTYVCADCELKRFGVSESLQPVERCPFCAGPVVPSGYSYVGDRGYHLSSMCYSCKAAVQTYSPACSSVPW